MNKLRLPLRLFSHSIFWGWNLLFITTVYLGILPFIGIPLIVATFDGNVPLDFCLTFFTLIAVPIASTFIGFKYLRQQPKELMRFFYGVEAPLFTWCLVRLFLIRELTLATTLILGTLLICILAFAVEVLEGYKANNKIFSRLQSIAHTLMLLMGVYLGLVLLFYAIPVAFSVIAGIGYFIVEFFSFKWIQGLQYIFSDGIYWIYSLIWVGFFLVLFGFTSTVFVGMPFAITGLYIHSGQKILRAFAKQFGRTQAISGAVAIISLWIILLFSLDRQPQVKAFELLNRTPQNRQELLASSEIIRKGLVNANLYPYRYLSSQERNNHIYSMYNNLGFPKSISSSFQQTYNKLLSPFLYRGSKDDVDRSAKLYAEFFDTPIQKAERKSLRHAIQSTAIVDQAKAGLLNIDQKKVWLEKQEVTLDPHGDWANVEIHEVYKNQTNDVEEILYYFSLPESSAITGVWLGETDDRSKRFPFQVSPRGAAQEVYNSQVRRTRPVDPALLEQVGPGQYRLRAFPVPPKLTTRQIRRGRIAPEKMHLWLTYKVMKQDNGWALPKLAERRNIYWTNHTKRIRNGKVKRFFGDTWLEDFWKDNLDSQKTSHDIKLKDGYRVKVQPLTDKDYSLPTNKKYALILDTSYSMGDRLSELKETFNWLKENLTNNHLDLYITDSEQNKSRYLNNINNFDPDELTFFGSIQNKQMLQQFQLLRNSRDYDAILLLSDRGSYELSDDKKDIPEINTPLWTIHLGGELPRAYNDTFLETIQNTNGGVATNIPTVMKRLATEESNNSSVVDGYSWTIEKNKTITTNNSNKTIEPLAARQLVYDLSKKGNNKLSLTELDTIHNIAKRNDIVTPYSSMIVLVNDRQREMLKKAEAKDDRFDREVETGVEQLNQPFNPLDVSAVPEPETWMLLGIVLLALLLVFQKQKNEHSID